MSTEWAEVPEHELRGLYAILSEATEAASTGDPNRCSKLTADAKRKVLEIHGEYYE